MRGFILLTLGFAAMAGFATRDFDANQLVPDEAGAISQEDKPSPPRSDASSYGRLEISRAADGHFWVEARINGARAEALVDTGASSVALSREDARRAGIHLNASDFTGQAATAGGTVAMAAVTLDRVEVGPLVARNVSGVVLDTPGMPPLLGQSFLRELREVAIREDRLVMR